jgi:hypothetical protein
MKKFVISSQRRSDYFIIVLFFSIGRGAMNAPRLLNMRKKHIAGVRIYLSAVSNCFHNFHFAKNFNASPLMKAIQLKHLCQEQSRWRLPLIKGNAHVRKKGNREYSLVKSKVQNCDASAVLHILLLYSTQVFHLA